MLRSTNLLKVTPSIRAFSTTQAAKFAKMTMIGTIGSDLTLQTTSSDKDYLKYSIAINARNKGVQTTSWFNIAVFNPVQIEFMQKHLGKGAKVYIEADASNSAFEREDGTKSYNLMLFQNAVEVVKYPKAKEGEEGESA